jgi:AGCS family alanine or glycine:cation symporter
MLAAFNTQDTFSGFAFYSKSTSVVVGAVLAALFGFCILGGGRRLTKVTEILVPVMGVLYVAVSLYVVITHIGSFPAVFGSIFRSAFDFKAILGGFSGSCVMWGIKRGLYSNEAGMGSAPNASASADVSHPAKQGLVQMLSVFIDTLLICSATAFLCLFSGVEPSAESAGAAYVQSCTRTALGSFGAIFIAVAVCLFAFTTLLGNYYYTENCLRFIMKKEPGKGFLFAYRLIATALVFAGAVISASLAWDTADLLQALMVIINVPVIVLLAKPAVAALRDYEWQRRKGKLPAYRAEANGVKGTDFWQNV